MCAAGFGVEIESGGVARVRDVSEDRFERGVGLDRGRIGRIIDERGYPIGAIDGIKFDVAAKLALEVKQSHRIEAGSLHNEVKRRGIVVPSAAVENSKYEIGVTHRRTDRCFKTSIAANREPVNAG